MLLLPNNGAMYLRNTRKILLYKIFTCILFTEAVDSSLLYFLSIIKMHFIKVKTNFHTQDVSYLTF